MSCLGGRPFLLLNAEQQGELVLTGMQAGGLTVVQPCLAQLRPSCLREGPGCSWASSTMTRACPALDVLQDSIAGYAYEIESPA